MKDIIIENELKSYGLEFGLEVILVEDGYNFFKDSKKIGGICSIYGINNLTVFSVKKSILYYADKMDCYGNLRDNNVAITKDNIHLYYEFMSDEDKINNSSFIKLSNIEKIYPLMSNWHKEICFNTVHLMFAKRKSILLKTFSNNKNIVCNTKLFKAEDNFFLSDDGYFNVSLYCFNIEDTLKPVKEYIAEIKESDAYKKYVSAQKQSGELVEPSTKIKKEEVLSVEDEKILGSVAFLDWFDVHIGLEFDSDSELGEDEQERKLHVASLDAYKDSLLSFSEKAKKNRHVMYYARRVLAEKLGYIGNEQTMVLNDSFYVSDDGFVSYFTTSKKLVEFQLPVRFLDGTYGLKL